MDIMHMMCICSTVVINPVPFMNSGMACLVTADYIAAPARRGVDGIDAIMMARLILAQWLCRS
jgi:hypothetical protein